MSDSGLQPAPITDSNRLGTIFLWRLHRLSLKVFCIHCIAFAQQMYYFDIGRADYVQKFQYEPSH